MRKSLLIKMFITTSSALLILAILLTNPLIVKAVDIFSTFGSGGSYDPNNGAGIFGPPEPEQNIAAKFTPGSDYFFDSADLALVVGEFPPSYTSNTFDVWLMSDSGGLPGSTIESLSVSIPFFVTGIYSVSSVSHPVLIGGTTYWVAVSPDGSAKGAWLANDQGYTGLAVGHLGPPFGLNESQTTPAFRVEGTPVPEPTTMLLLGSGLLGLWGARRKFKK